MQTHHKYYNHTNKQHYIVQYNNRKVCVCQLCSCGNHELCPQNNHKSIFQTTSSAQFKPYRPIPQTTPSTPFRYQPRNYTPDTLMTNYQQHYKKQHEFQSSRNAQELMANSRFSEVGKTILAPNVKFNGVTSYNEHYQPYQKVNYEESYLNPQQIDVLTPYKSQKYQKPNVKFQAISSYKSTYLPPPPKEITKSIKPKTYMKPQASFYGHSSYKDDYKPIGIIHKEQDSNHVTRLRLNDKGHQDSHLLPYRNSQQNLNSQIYLSPRTPCRLDDIYIPDVKFTYNKYGYQLPNSIKHY